MPRVLVEIATGAISTIVPRYITATRSLTWRTTDRSCEMNRYVQPELVLQVVEQVQDLRPDRHVERRHRLVADDEVGLQRDGARDADALALAAREVAREAVVVLGIEPDQLHQLLHAPGRSAPRREAVDLERIADDRADAPARIERAVRDPGRPSASGAGTAAAPPCEAVEMSWPSKMTRRPSGREGA